MKTTILTAFLIIMLHGVTPVAYANSNPYIGQLMWTGTNFCPRGWLRADGSLYPIAQNTALFSLLGTMYGGDGRTTFGMPDLRGRAAINSGNGPGLSDYRQGQWSGAEQITLNTSQLPSHNHSSSFTGTAVANKEAATTEQPQNNMNSDGQRTALYDAVPAEPTNEVDLETAKVKVSGFTATTGGNLSHENRAPFITITVCVASVGVFPSRS